MLNDDRHAWITIVVQFICLIFFLARFALSTNKCVKSIVRDELCRTHCRRHNGRVTHIHVDFEFTRTECFVIYSPLSSTVRHTIYRANWIIVIIKPYKCECLSALYENSLAFATTFSAILKRKNKNNLLLFTCSHAHAQHSERTISRFAMMIRTSMIVVYADVCFAPNHITDWMSTVLCASSYAAAVVSSSLQWMEPMYGRSAWWRLVATHAQCSCARVLLEEARLFCVFERTWLEVHRSRCSW